MWEKSGWPGIDEPQPSWAPTGYRKAKSHQGGHIIVFCSRAVVDKDVARQIKPQPGPLNEEALEATSELIPLQVEVYKIRQRLQPVHY